MSEVKTLNLNESIIKIRSALQNVTLKKSGKNTHMNFNYFELSDFLPTLNELMLVEGVNDCISFEKIDGDQYCTLTLIKGEEKQSYAIPFTEYHVPMSTKQGKPVMQEVQYLGALNTYLKRYLYLNAFGITDGEIIDGMDNADLKSPKTPAKPKVDKKAPKPTISDKVNTELDTKKKEIVELIKTHNLDNASIAQKFNLDKNSTVADFDHAIVGIKAIVNE